MSTEKPRRLGRGLEALLATTAQPLAHTSSVQSGGGVGGGMAAARGEPADYIQRIPVGQIRPNPYQPRREFRPEDLSELEASLRASGLLQPITVRKLASDSYELIVGERRLRAAAKIGWTEIPAVVKESREVDERTLLTLALVENLQRADLNPLEEAQGYKRLTDEFGLTQQQVAGAVGKDRSTIANFLRVLSLPTPVRQMLSEGLLTLGHARALLALLDDRRMLEFANEVVAKQLSVREVERRVRAANAADANEPTQPRDGEQAQSRAPSLPAPSNQTSPELRRIEDQLRRHLQTDVHLALTGKEKGVLRIGFYSSDDLERVLDLILSTKRSDFDDTGQATRSDLGDLDEIIFP
ncbi:MAG: ParB/RepB/Spo0J family partition protein [Gemmatimonadota bacterium]|nr:ParB/RepB/Spo0J family partition protein [Gemmatimonadota bacterium]